MQEEDMADGREMDCKGRHVSFHLSFLRLLGNLIYI